MTTTLVFDDDSLETDALERVTPSFVVSSNLDIGKNHSSDTSSQSVNISLIISIGNCFAAEKVDSSEWNIPPKSDPSSFEPNFWKCSIFSDFLTSST